MQIRADLFRNLLSSTHRAIHYCRISIDSSINGRLLFEMLACKERQTNTSLAHSYSIILSYPFKHSLTHIHTSMVQTRFYAIFRFFLLLCTQTKRIIPYAFYATYKCPKQLFNHPNESNLSDKYLVPFDSLRYIKHRAEYGWKSITQHTHNWCLNDAVNCCLSTLILVEWVECFSKELNTQIAILFHSPNFMPEQLKLVYLKTFQKFPFFASKLKSSEN